jgi:hypothetical protein
VETVKKFVFNRTFMLAVATVVSVIAGALGYQIPHVPETWVSLALAVATGLHAVSAQEAAYLQGLIESAQEQNTTTPTA